MFAADRLRGCRGRVRRCLDPLGGSQFLNSPATGNYMATSATRSSHSSTPCIRRPPPRERACCHRTFLGRLRRTGAADAPPRCVRRRSIAHAPDTLFEACYVSRFLQHDTVLRDHYEGFLRGPAQGLRRVRTFDWSLWGPDNAYAMAAAYSPDLDSPGKVLLLFDTESGLLIPEIWERWRRATRCDGAEVRRRAALAPPHPRRGRPLRRVHARRRRRRVLEGARQALRQAYSSSSTAGTAARHIATPRHQDAALVPLEAPGDGAGQRPSPSAQSS